MQPEGDTTTQSATQGSVMKSAAFMSLGTLASRVLGLVRDMLIASMFSAFIRDAFVVAFRLPNLFRRILGEGSLSASFVPLFIGEKKAPEFANAVFTLLSLVTAVLSVAGVVFMEPLLGLLVSGEGYQSVVGKFEFTVKMARIMFGFLFLVMTYAFLMSVLNAYKKFFLAALAPAAFNLTLVIFALLPSFQFDGDQLAWGVLLGGVVQLAFVIIPLWRMGHLPKFQAKIWSKLVSQFFRILLPSMAGMGITQILVLLNVYFASRLPEGSHSYIYFADRLLEFPQSLIAVSLGVALLPTLSEHWSNGEKSKMVAVVQEHVRLLLYLALPAALGLYLMAYPLVSMIYLRGEFSVEDALITSSILQIYAVVLVIASLHRVIVPSFYAMKNTWLPAVNSGISVLIHIFVASWATDTYGLMGLVGATAFTASVNLLLLLIAFRFYFQEIGLMGFLKTTLWCLPSLAGMAVVVYIGKVFLISLLGGVFGSLVTIVWAAAIYVMISLVLKQPEALKMSGMIERRFIR